MLHIQNLTAGYSGPSILQDVNIEVKEGEMVALIGPNGAGKSTVLRSIFGLTTIHNGDILYFNESLRGLPTEQVIRRGICYVPQNRALFPTLTVEENLEMGGYIREDQKSIKSHIARVYEKFPLLREHRDQKAKLLSGGQQQMLAIGRALMLEPKLLLLDEPSIGLAPNIVQEVFEKIIEIKSTGTAILIVEQNAHLALEMADRAYVLELGKNRYEGTGKELLKDPKIGELYLGR